MLIGRTIKLPSFPDRGAESLLIPVPDGAGDQSSAVATACEGGVLTGRPGANSARALLRSRGYKALLNDPL
jgi:hypothetical protein